MECKKNILVAELPQPPESEWKFIDELREPAIKRIAWNKHDAGISEISLTDGVMLVPEFQDKNGLLDTAYADMKRFFALAGIPEAPEYRVVTAYAELEKEAYRIEVNDSECRISAGDAEGIRRGIFYLQDELLRTGGPFLTKGVIVRKPVIKTRISRCFFGPLKRPPNYKDELLDDVDYYPDEYLNRLAHEGINGLWLTVSFKDLAKTGIVPHGEHIERRRNKLRKTIVQCRRYGISIYLFCNEPLAFDKDDPVLKKYPELGGTTVNGKVCFCPSSATAQTYLRTAFKNIFSAVPGLGGMIVLSVGEWLTLCTNAGIGLNNCPHCSHRPPWQSLALSLGAMEQGMHEAAPGAELISWPYTQPSYWGMRESVEAAAHVPDNVTLMHNFESHGSRIQLGEKRKITDYWLSYIGPSNFFKRCATKAEKHGTKMFAKLQVGCSHEVATTQYVPVPGNLYKKYKAMHELGVSGAMQCWYFGAYPSLMTKAAGELAFAPFPASEQEFLVRLAKLYWGEYSREVVKAWKHFSESYRNYPLNNVLGYIGPMHDGIVWPLHLEPVNRRLTPTWEIGPTPGDRIGECLGYSYSQNKKIFTMDETIILLEKLCRKWEKGVKILNRLEQHFIEDEDRMREIGVAKALGILFRSGLNIFRFYKLRESIAVSFDNSRQTTLDEMKKIVLDEIESSKTMLMLTMNDSSLGFHSEAEGYKFHSEKLRLRIKSLEALLLTEFPRTEHRIRRQLAAFPEYIGQTSQGKVVSCNYFNHLPEQSAWDSLPEQYLGSAGTLDLTFKGAYPHISFSLIDDNRKDAYWRAGYSDNMLFFNLVSKEPRKGEKFKIEIETERLCWHNELVISLDGTVIYNGNEVTSPTLAASVHKTGSSLDLKLAVPFSFLNLPERFCTPVRVNVLRIYTDSEGVEITQSWITQHPLKTIFVLGFHNPDDFGWLAPETRHSIVRKGYSQMESRRTEKAVDSLMANAQ
jgi:hypothetical protein